jgi:hypothetical protein
MIHYSLSIYHLYATVLNYRHQFPQKAVIPYTFAAIYHTVKTYILNKQSTNTLALQKRNIDPMFNLK